MFDKETFERTPVFDVGYLDVGIAEGSEWVDTDTWTDTDSYND